MTNENHPTGRLVVLTGKETGRTFSITGAVTIGRVEGNEVIIRDASVSRRHARVEPVEGGFLVTDLGSRNKITARRKTATSHNLSVGDEFSLGDVRIKILPAAKEEIPAEHAVMPVAAAPKVAVTVQEGAEEFFEGAKPGSTGSRRIVIVLGVIAVVVLIGYAVAPFSASGPAVTTLDVVVDEGMEKAVGVWNGRARVPRTASVKVGNKRIADVTVDTGDGFIIKVVGNSPGITEASGMNRSGGKTVINVVVRPRADESWELEAKEDNEKRRTALYHIGLARDIESHSPYEAMKEYGLAGRILEQLDPRPKEYSDAALNESRLRKQIDAQMEEYVKTYQLAMRAERYESAAAELRKISKLVSNSEDYTNQKAKLLYVRLMKILSRKKKK